MPAASIFILTFMKQGGCEISSSCFCDSCEVEGGFSFILAGCLYSNETID